MPYRGPTSIRSVDSVSRVLYHTFIPSKNFEQEIPVCNIREVILTCIIGETAPAIIHQELYRGRTSIIELERISVNIVREVEKVDFVIEVFSFEFSLEENTGAIVLLVKVHGVACTQFPHKPGNALVFHLSEHQVIMIGHETECEYLYKQKPPDFST